MDWLNDVALAVISVVVLAVAFIKCIKEDE